MSEFETKDSGKRLEYDSGMVRDTNESKPRFDLLFPEGVPYKDQLITRFASLMQRGAEKYGDSNWQKANSEIELKRFKSSALRHMMQWFNGELDEDHCAATWFNMMAYEATKYKIQSNPTFTSDRTTLNSELTKACKTHQEIRLIEEPGT